MRVEGVVLHHVMGFIIGVVAVPHVFYACCIVLGVAHRLFIIMASIVCSTLTRHDHSQDKCIYEVEGN